MALSDDGVLCNFTSDDFEALWGYEDSPLVRPTIASISPNTAVVGGPDITVTVTGTGFTDDTVIIWNGGTEPTTFIDSTHVSTVVKPSTASGPITIPVTVKTRRLRAATSVDFTFTAA